VVVGWPRAELARWEDADGVVGRRLADLCRLEGWILRPEELHRDEAALLAAAERETGDDLVWRAGTDGGTGYLPLGVDEGVVPLRWEGTLPPGEPARLEAESKPWLASARRMRWEEVVEILDLTAEENRAFQLQRDGAGPFASIRAAYLRDKSGANVAIYLAGTRRPRALLWRLELNRAFEETVSPLAASLLAEPLPAILAARGAGAPPGDARDPGARDAARRRLFARRLLASRSRVYGRADRILLSLAAEAPRGTMLIVDARDSRDPFVAVLVVGQRLGRSTDRGSRLRDRLERGGP
jgi:hypothetical protein